MSIEMRVVKFLADKGFGFAKEETMGGRIVFFHINNGVILKPSLINSEPQFSSQKSDRVPQKDDLLIAEVHTDKKGSAAKKWGFSDQHSDEEAKLPEFRLMIQSDEVPQQKQWWRYIGYLNKSSVEIDSVIKSVKKSWFETRSPNHGTNDQESGWEKCEDPRM